MPCPLRPLALILALSLAVASAKTLTGRQVFDQTCHVCHSHGVAGAPKVGDRSAWREHLDKGLKILYAHAIHGYYGYSFMPPKGGNESLTDSEVRAAVRYMVATVSAKARRTLDPHQ